MLWLGLYDVSKISMAVFNAIFASSATIFPVDAIADITCFR